MLGKKTQEENGWLIGSSIQDVEHPNLDEGVMTMLQAPVDKALFFISVSCVYCIDLLPYLKGISEKHSIQIILISSGSTEDHEEMREYFGWTFPIVEMNIRHLQECFQVTKLPFMMLIDKNGTVVGKGVIYNDADFEMFIAKGVFP